MEKQRNSNSKPVSWIRGKNIGKGCFGSVSIAVSKSDGSVFAVKSVDRDTCLPVQLESLENEIRILRSIPTSSNSHIVGFLGDDVSFEATTSYRNLHLEYCPGGTVADLAYRQEIDENVLRRYTWCVVSALRDVHSNGVIHCDVKGKNILLGPDSTSVKLADFGSAIKESTNVISPRGSPLWMAPEVVRWEYQGVESDVWSLGCTVIEMFTGKPAWEDNGIHTLRKIGFSDELPLFPTRLSELGCDFLDKCLKKEPSQRWSCVQLLQHPFLSLDQTVSTGSSPRCVLDWSNNSEFAKCGIESELNSEFEYSSNGVSSGKDRIGKLASMTGANWESDGWTEVRDCNSNYDENEGTSTEYPDFTRVEREFQMTISSVYSDTLSLWITEEEEVERIEREFGYSQSDFFLEWQYCNINEILRVEVWSYWGRRWDGGPISRYGPRNMGFAVGRWFNSCILKFLCLLRMLINYFGLFLFKLFGVFYFVPQFMHVTGTKSTCFIECHNEHASSSSFHGVNSYSTIITLKGIFI